MDDLIAFLRAIYDNQAADHSNTRYGCMQCGSDWPCYPMRDIDSRRRILDETVPILDDMEERINNEWGYTGEPLVESGKLLRLLAAPHNDEPGYLKEWTPQWAT